jgi:hypothetical protein
MKSSISENSSESKELKRFVSRHSNAFADWEILYRIDNDVWEEIPMDIFLDLIARDAQWYTTFLNNIKVRLTK